MRMGAADRAIAGSGLPAEVQAFVRRIVRRTRLRPGERADVARELCSHFDEALAAGRSPADAIAAYGDPLASARLLRAGAVAKRHPLDRALGQTLWFAGYAFGAFVAAYLAFTLYLHFKQPVIAVDSLQAFRERLAVPAKPDDAAWPRYREALLALMGPLGDPERQSPGFVAVNDEPWPGDAGWDVATRWLAAHAGALADLRAATRRPVFGFPAGREFDDVDARLFGSTSQDAMRTLIATRNDPASMPMVGILLPQLSAMRSAARMLAVDATHAVATGDGERMVADIEAMMAMSVHTQDGRILIGDLVGIAIRSLARTRMIALVERNPELPNAAQLERLQRAVSAVPPALEHLDLGAERLMWVDVMQRFFTDDGNGNGWFRMDRSTFLPLVGVLESTSGETYVPRDAVVSRIATVLPVVSSPAAAFLVADRRETRETFETWGTRFEEASTWPIRDHARIGALESEFVREVPHMSLRLVLPRLLMPALGRACVAYAQDRAWADAAATACAAARFRRDTGAWPARAEDLAPKYLPAVPEDPWTGKPVRMGGTDADFRIWSVGEDLVDDGGQPEIDDGLTRGRSASTVCFRHDDRRSGRQEAQGDAPRVDWVWFAPGDAGARWHVKPGGTP
jgi:hypothetical protein